MIELFALWRQRLRCRRGDHDWYVVATTRRSDAMACNYCPTNGYRIKETSGHD